MTAQSYELSISIVQIREGTDWAQGPQRATSQTKAWLQALCFGLERMQVEQQEYKREVRH